MNAISRSTVAMALLAAVAGCNGSSPSENEAAPVANDMAMDNMMMADPSNPYGQTEMKMHDAMMAAAGSDVSDTWVKKMIEHHRGAIEMSNIALAQGAGGRVREMAQMTITKQSKEISELEAMAKQGAPSTEGGALYRPAEMQMHERMMAAKGADPSETWVRKMIEHHRGGIAMSEIVIARGQDGRVKEKARKAAADQTKEIGELEKLLNGEAASAPLASAAAPAKEAPEAAPQPKVVARPKAETPNAAPKEKPRTAPAPDPHAGHDMNNMSN